MSVDFELPKGTKSYNLYKLHPPFKKLVNGHGYPGVVLERVNDGKLQCHVCGEWFGNLAQHIFHAHKLKAKEYRKKFSLRQKDTLVCKTMSDQRRLMAKSPDNLELLRKIHLIALKKRRLNKKQYLINKGAASRESKNTLAALNEKGLCPDQINFRFDTVAEQLRKQPTVHELRERDNPLYGAIVYKFGTFNKYIEYRGMQPLLPLKCEKTPDIKIIAAIRNIYRKNGKVTARDFHSGNNSPAWSTVHDRFGSLENACREAGIDSSNWTMVG